MNETARRVRHSAAPRSLNGAGGTPIADSTARKNAAAALQRALDRRDNGGATGH
ncbi:hypothetical protein ABZW18_29930 [Streptomyces sp. NPDC004647]|uniref:hypothetical protein n=1 Tax=Streptomyces sp. NPDC004647 TaxID=3154671 RepID=UPI0033B3F698